MFNEAEQQLLAVTYFLFLLCFPYGQECHFQQQNVWHAQIYIYIVLIPYP